MIQEINRAVDNLEVDTKEKVLKGTAIKFNTYSCNVGGFIETVREGALDNVKFTHNNNLFIVYNHDMHQPLGSTDAGNLKYWIDDVGLHFEVKLNNSSYANDLYENVKSGIVKGCSFKMWINPNDYRSTGEYKDGLPVKELLNIEEIEEITITHIPAYKDTLVEARNKKKISIEAEILKMKVELL